MNTPGFLTGFDETADPNDPFYDWQFHLNRSRALNAHGDVQQAIMAAKKSVELANMKPVESGAQLSAHFQLGVLYLTSRQTALAVRHLRTATELLSTCSNGPIVKAIYYALLGMAEIAHGDPAAGESIGRAEMHLNREIEAIERFRREHRSLVQLIFDWLRGK